jgi:hypothetical protein
MDRCRAGLVIFVALVEDRQVDVLVHQPVDGVFQGPRDKLVLERDGEHDHLIFIAGFVFCHGFLYCIEPRHMNLVIKISHLFRQFQRFALPALGRGRRSRPARKMIRRRKLLEICAESPASGARFVGWRGINRDLLILNIFVKYIFDCKVGRFWF